jgi:hypothetical protein
LLSLPLEAWPVLELPTWPEVQTWTVDGSTFAASAKLAMRVPRGDVTLLAKLSGGRERSTVLQVPEGGLRMDERTLRTLLRMTNDERRAPAPDPDTIMRVVTAGTPALQRCYERSLKQRPDVGGRLVLRIVVDGGGRVRHVTPRSETEGVSEDLLRCIRSSAESWRFPPPGPEGITFDAPIRLSNRH